MNRILKNILIIVPSAAMAVVLLFLVVNLRGQEKSVSSTEVEDSINTESSISSIDETVDTQSTPNTSSSTDTQITDKSTTQVTVTKTLSVAPDRCIGCGKCVRTDPEHFALTGRIASVISNDNLTSSKLTSAIYNCPEDAITLN